jgi:UDP-N-acetylmuramate dehydrogenase
LRDPLTSFVKIAGVTVEAGVPFSRLTSWRVGGPAKYLIHVQSETALVETISLIKEMELPLLLLGNGTNILASEHGFDGAVVKLTGYFTRLGVDGTRITVGSGAALNSVVRAAHDASLSGVEFAQGIPGTVGGAVMMNAGAYGGMISKVVERVETVAPNGEQRSHESFIDTYRDALVPTDEIVTVGVFRLKTEPLTKIKRRMDKMKNQRKGTQPWGQATAGSVFKNPAGDYAGRLIEECGMKGVAVGSARVSTVHANFIVNEGGASVSDIKDLIECVSNEVRDHFGIELETEVRLIGFEEE